MTKQEFPCVVPDGTSGDWKVETFEVSKREAEFSGIRAIMHPEERVEAGTYKRLTRKGTVVMSNTQMEMRTNKAIIFNARGRVLINGLGLGLVLTAILKKSEVEHVTVIEKSEDVIKLVGPSFSKERVTIIHADAYEYKPKKGERFDTIWHDIWDFICGDNVKEMQQLRRKWCRRATWQGFWCQYECMRANRY